MNAERVGVFIALCLLFNLTPGPDVLLVVRQAVSRGRAHGAALAFGSALGSLAWGVAAAIGLAALISRTPQAHRGLTIAGGLYLSFLAIRTWRAAGTTRAQPSTVAHPESLDLTPIGRVGLLAPSAPARSLAEVVAGTAGSLLTGLTANLLNPKMGAFYLAFLPAFIPTGAPIGRSALLLSALECVIALIVLIAYAGLAARLASTFVSPRGRKITDRLLASTLMIFAVLVVAGA